MSPVNVEKITGPLLLGEGPHWDARAQALYFVSIHDRSIHKYVPATRAHTQTKLDGRPGFIIPLAEHEDQFLVGVERKFLVLRWDGSDGGAAQLVRELAEVDRHTPGNRLNDGKADPRGRVYAGTMGHESSVGVFEEEKGALFLIEGGAVTELLSGVSISNGLAWDVSRRAFYYTDSPERKVRRYDYDVDTGKISNMRYHFDLAAAGVAGFPDGSTIDAAGNLWVAVFDGGCVLQVSPQGALLRRVDIPAAQVTSCTFGGPNFDVLFVTTASYTHQGAAPPGAGCTYMVTGLGVQGLENVNCRV